MTLSPAATIVLTRAAGRPDHRLEFHRRLPAVARRKMIEALRRDGLITGEANLAPTGEDPDSGLMLTSLTLTGAGFHAIGREPAEPPMPTATHTARCAPSELPAPQQDGGGGANAACESPRAATGRVGARPSLRATATALLIAWDAGADLASAIDALRSAITSTKPPRATAPRESRPVRTNTKQAAVLALLRRPEGATIAQVVALTGWAQHTVRGFFAGLKRKGVFVEPIERVRQVGPHTQGAKGSYAVYRLAEAT